jgi:hypothetical protein
VVVDLQHEGTATQFAVKVCAGLFNRDGQQQRVFTLMGDMDSTWLSVLYGIKADPEPIDTFLSHCLATVAGGRRIRYNYTEQIALVPNVMTVAAVLDAVPLEDGAVPAGAGPVVTVFDALAAWENLSLIEATNAIHGLYVQNTSSMAMINPGYDNTKHVPNPPITGQPPMYLVDWIVKARLFTFYLPNGCIPDTPEHALMEKIVNNNPWPRYGRLDKTRAQSCTASCHHQLT